MRLALLLLLAAAAHAQPAPDALLDAWRADWRRAASGVEAVTARESSAWTVEGPRGRTRVEARGTLRYDGGRPERSLDEVRVDGRRVSADRGRGQGRRWERAFGPAGREVHAPPALPGVALARADARGIAEDRIGGTPAWRVDLDTPLDEARVWFTRSASSPRLLAARFEGRRPRGGRIVREVRYVRVEGLDVPAEARTTFTARQRRRLREYFVTLTAVGTYTGHELR